MVRHWKMILLFYLVVLYLSCPCLFTRHLCIQLIALNIALYNSHWHPGLDKLSLILSSKSVAFCFFWEGGEPSDFSTWAEEVIIISVCVEYIDTYYQGVELNGEMMGKCFWSQDWIGSTVILLRAVWNQGLICPLLFLFLVMSTTSVEIKNRQFVFYPFFST